MDLTKQMFELWRRYRAGRLRHDTLRRKIEEANQRQFYTTLEGGHPGRRGRSVRTRRKCSHAPTVSRCHSLFDRFDQLWTFAHVPGVEPTNNRAEQSLHHAVIWRKLSFGTQSESGSRFVETLLTIVETCRQQRRHTLDFLTAAPQAHLNSTPAPILLNGA
jgi:transposase